MVRSLREAGLPAVGISYGSNDESLAVMPMDWGTLIPLWFLGGRTTSRGRSSSSRPLAISRLADHVRAGAAVVGRVLGEACGDRSRAPITDTRTIPKGRSGSTLRPPSTTRGRRPRPREPARDVVELEPIVDAASADSLWQLVLLHGALGDGFDAELLSYECPTYFGMLCAAFEPRDP